MKQMISVFLICLLMVSCIDKSERPSVKHIIPEKQNFCYDILSMVAGKPDHTSLLSCNFFRDSQVLYLAKYFVSGEHAAETENFLIKHFGMGPLFFVCCVWETRNNQGYVYSANYETDFRILGIDMYSEETLKDERSLWNEADTFYITVSLLEL